MEKSPKKKDDHSDEELEPRKWDKLKAKLREALNEMGIWGTLSSREKWCARCSKSRQFEEEYCFVVDKYHILVLLSTKKNLFQPYFDDFLTVPHGIVNKKTHANNCNNL